MPRPPAEAGILLERDDKGRAVAAGVTWKNVMGEEPQQVTVSFDGRPIVMDALQRVRIPAHSAEVVHVVTVELDFAAASSLATMSPSAAQPAARRRAS